MKSTTVEYFSGISQKTQFVGGTATSSSEAFADHAERVWAQACASIVASGVSCRQLFGDEKRLQKGGRRQARAVYLCSPAQRVPAAPNVIKTKQNKGVG